MNNPLMQMPSEGAALHVLVTKPGAIAGSDAQRQEIARSLPMPTEGKHWAYQPMAVYPLRFATIHDADMFMEFIGRKEVTDRFFVAPMLYDQRQTKWRLNKAWEKAHAELVVFALVDNTAEPASPPAVPVAVVAPEAAQ